MLCFDNEIINFIQNFPQSTVINLGEGLENQRFRIPNEGVQWVCVDLPDVIKYFHYQHIAHAA